MHESLVARAVLSVAALVAILAAGPALAADDPRLLADHWAGRCPGADRVLLGPVGVADFNRRLLAVDPSVRDMTALAARLVKTDVTAAIAALARLPETALVSADGTAVEKAHRERWAALCKLDAIPDHVEPRFGLVTRRAALRRFPTAEGVHRAGGPADIDLVQESAFFPGTPVAAVHATADGRWAFVLGTTYAAWVETAAIAFADRDAVLDFSRRSRLIVTAAAVQATLRGAGREAIATTLDMGTALPAGRGDAPAGQRVVELPSRSESGTLQFVPARIEPADALHDGPLPATRRHILRQAFRFLGEPYGWGHDHGARDCSGFVCEVYRSLGILLPRNTRDQAISPALDRTAVEPDWPRDRRLAAIARLLPGDLVYVPRHVMMIVGHDEAGPWVIHDTHTGRLAGDSATAHGVVVAPLQRILTEDGGFVVDAVTTLVRILPTSPSEQP